MQTIARSADAWSQLGAGADPLTSASTVRRVAYIRCQQRKRTLISVLRLSPPAGAFWRAQRVSNSTNKKLTKAFVLPGDVAAKLAEKFDCGKFYLHPRSSLRRSASHSAGRDGGNEGVQCVGHHSAGVLRVPGVIPRW